MGHQHYSEDFKKSVVKKFLNRGSRPVATIIEEAGISPPALYRWRAEFASTGGMKKGSKRPQDRTAEDKLDIVIAFEKLPEAKRGEFLREKGLHSDNIAAWREQIKSALNPSNKRTRTERSERAEDRRKIKELERELRRKDKALAETAALLVLKKKANSIWGTGEDE